MANLPSIIGSHSDFFKRLTGGRVASAGLFRHLLDCSTTRDWNSLSIEAKQADSVNSFQRFLNMGKSTVPNHYYIGCRKAQILHTRIRTNCSSLNLDL